MRTLLTSAAWVLCAALLVGCGKKEQPPPDGSCGIEGVCLLPEEPPGKDGELPPRRVWPGLDVHAVQINSPDADYDRKFRTLSGTDGKFRLALNPGEYSVGVYDGKLLKNKMLSPMTVKVEPGRFTEIVIDYEKLNVRDLPKQR